MQESRARSSQDKVTIGAVIALDQLSKAIGRHLITTTGGRGILRPQWTDGLIGQANVAPTHVLSATSIALGVMAWLYFNGDKTLKPWIALILAGGGSNLIDRVLFGSVLDIFSVPGLQVNLADGAILVGVLGAAYEILYTKRKILPR